MSESHHPPNGANGSPISPNNPPISTNDNLIKLLQFQEQFISLVHSQLYSHPTITDHDLLRFQINHITDLNEVWNGMVQQLTVALVDDRTPYNTILRDYFQKILNVDYLPLLRINRYEATQLSLFGFDIYIAPLSALLEIINRLDGLKNSLLHLGNEHLSELQADCRDTWNCLGRGWSSFLYSSLLWRLSFNVYLFKEYLKIGAKSLPRKDKQIVFTGCNNLFAGLVPFLKEKQQIWVLVELSELANELYCFHPSFAYEYFFTLLLPLKTEYEPVLRAVGFIGEKCMNANIVTPLLFAILRQSNAFLQFVEQADDECWVQYLEGIAYGLVINFKARILEYREAMDILKAAIIKLGVLGRLNLSFLPGDLGKEWAEAREFFISALKVGYHFGDLQTWHTIEEPRVQPELIEYARDALLMLHQPDPQQIKMFIGEKQPCELLIQHLEELCQTAMTMEHFTTTFSEKTVQGIEQPLRNKGILLMLSNEVKLCGLSTNFYVVNYMLQFLVKAGFKMEDQAMGVLSRRLKSVGKYYLEQAKTILTDSDTTKSYILKSTVFDYCDRYYTVSQSEEVFSMLFWMCDSKQALQSIFKIIETHDATSEADRMSELIAACIVSKYLHSETVAQTDLLSLKTFSKQYLVPRKLVSLDSRLYTCMGALIERMLWSDNKFISGLSQLILFKVVAIRPWMAAPLLSFPVSFSYTSQDINQSLKLQAFSLWFIKSSKGRQSYSYLLLLLQQAEAASRCPQIWPHPATPEYIQSCNLSVCEQIVGHINCKVEELSRLEDSSICVEIMRLLQLLWMVQHKYCGRVKNPNRRFYRRMLKLYLRVFGNLEDHLAGSTTQTITVPDSCTDSRKQILDILLSSLANVYCPLLEKLYSDKARTWRAYIQKLCFISPSEEVEGLGRTPSLIIPKNCQLRPIKRDTDYLIENSIDYNQDCQYGKSSEGSFPSQAHLSQLRLGIQSHWGNCKKILQEEVWESEDFWQSVKDVDSELIKSTKLESVQESMRCRDYLLPSVSGKSMEQIMNYFQQVRDDKNSLLSRYRQKVVGLLKMNVHNHFKMGEWCIKASNKELLSQIGISRRLANARLPQILDCLLRQQVGSPHQQGGYQYIQTFCSPLDENSKQLLSDSFNIAAYQKQAGKVITDIILTSLDQHNQISSDNLSFLLTYSSSNWRHTIDWLCTHICSPSVHSSLHVNSMASLILQYMEYLRITGTSNRDYEERIGNYTKLLTGYSYMLLQKCKYIIKLEHDNLVNYIKEPSLATDRSSSSLSSYSVDLESADEREGHDHDQRQQRLAKHRIELVTTVISQQQIRLNYVNELTSIKMMVECGELREVLYRIAAFKKQVNETLKINDQQILTSTVGRFDGIISSAILINYCANCLGQALGGQIVTPDFLHHFRLCDSEVLNRFQIELGKAIEDYYEMVNEIAIKGQADNQLLPALEFFEKQSPKNCRPLVQFAQMHVPATLNVGEYQPIAEGLVVCVEPQSISNQLRLELAQRYNSIIKYLRVKKCLAMQDGKIDFSFEGLQDPQLSKEQDDADGEWTHLFLHLGILHSCLELQSQKSGKLGPLLLAVYNRQKLSYEMLRHYLPALYHQIKSILIDDNIKQRKLTFMHRNKELVPDGSDIPVTVANRGIYCNLLAKASLGRRRWRAVENFVRGVYSVIDSNA